jgi:hypothetical protein
MSGCWGSNLDNPPPSPSSSVSSVDDDEVNRRITPHWPTYNDAFLSRGFRLDTVRDVKAFYNCGSRSRTINSLEIPIPGYLHAYECTDDDVLCPDPGLVGVIQSFSYYSGPIDLPSPTTSFGGLRYLTARRLWSKLYISAAESTMSFVYFLLLRFNTRQ